MTIPVPMPKLGESVVKGTITKWFKADGDLVAKDEPILQVSTDKADVDVPSPAAGVLRILAPQDAEVEVETLIARIEPVGSATAPAPAPATSAPAAAAPAASSADAQRTSPVVRKLLRENQLEATEVQGTGEGNRVTRVDVEREVERRRVTPVASAPTQVAAPAMPATPPPARAQVASAESTRFSSGAFRVPPYAPQAGDEVIPFSRRRRIIADHMVYSKHVSPHVMTIAEIDLNKISRLREAKKNAYKAEGVNLTFLAFIAAATARALRENPSINARVLEDAYVKLKHVNLGIAVETPEGLVVPVIRDADELTVKGLARSIDSVAARAREGKITADDLAGATFTISNPGAKGNLVGAAVISQPNVGILRIGEINKRPVVVEVEGQDTIAIHPVMLACLSYDHRIVDGVAANNFLYRISELLEAGQFEV